jgi:hypothetical protein
MVSPTLATPGRGRAVARLAPARAARATPVPSARARLPPAPSAGPARLCHRAPVGQAFAVLVPLCTLVLAWATGVFRKAVA